MDNKTLDFYKSHINAYIDAYLTEKDEFTEMYEKPFRKIQNNEDVMTRLAQELYDNKTLKSIQDIDVFNYEINYYIQDLLKKETLYEMDY